MFRALIIRWTGRQGPVACALVVCGLALAGAIPARGADPKPQTGLEVTYAAAGGPVVDHGLAPAVALYVQAGQPVSPFVPTGKFTVTWQGSILAELRGNFSFEATVRGTLLVEINGSLVLQATGGADPVTSPLSKPVQLNKGPNVFKATFTSP